MDKPLAIVLGGTVPHIALIKKMRDRGYRVLLADYLADPPAKSVADEHVRTSTLDAAAVRSLAEERGAKIVISACIDQANGICCRVAGELGLPRPYDDDTALAVTDKERMKTVFAEHGVPSAAWQAADEVGGVDWARVSWPAVVKPVDCNSSKGVRFVLGEAEAKRRFAEALALSRSGRAIVENYCPGDEIQVDCVAAADGVKVMMTRLKRKVSAAGDGFTLQSWGSVFPAPLSPAVSARVHETARKIAAAFGLRNTPFFYQAIVSGGDLDVIEFAPRIGGGMSERILSEIAGYDPVECVIDSFLGKDIRVEPSAAFEYRSTNILYMKPGVFGRLSGVEGLLESGTVSECVMFKRPGDEVDGDLRSSNRIAALVVDGTSYEDLETRSLRVLSEVEIFDPDGKAMLNRDLYRKFLNQ